MSDGEDPGQDIPSAEAQLRELITRHQALDSEIERLHSFPYIDQLRMQRLKKQRLQLKETIERVKSRLIPDLDA
ncbi:MAG: YdcH family protein [Spongiibacteraceae bacterium]|jgi:hypothetical protein|nr:YdcH family protein [Spongiibacteraceae bacterium]